MYIPDPYKNRNKEEIKRFVQENGFGTLILSNTREVSDVEDSADDTGRIKPVETGKVRRTLARHLPFVVDLDSDHYRDGRDFNTLTAHLGIHYPIYRCFRGKHEASKDLPADYPGDEALVVFQGPHSYVSPTWYDNLEGATWNYISVHVYGRIERLGDTDLEKLIRTLLYKYEKHYRTNPQLTLDMVRSRYEYLKQFIGAIRIHVKDFDVDVQAAYKLSQDQTDWSRQNSIDHLRQTGDPNAIAVADEMERRRAYILEGKA